MTPMKPRTSRGLLLGAIAVLVIAVLLLLMLLSSGRSDAHSAPVPAPAETSAAVGFARDMAVHHQQAVEMSFAEWRNGASPDVRSLAYDMANTQATQRGMLLGWLAAWQRPATSSEPPMAWMHMPPPSDEDRREGVLMPGMADRSQMARLRSAKGSASDTLFLRLMIDHHRGGVHMAEGVAGQGAPESEARLARTMVQGQRAEISLMQDLLLERTGA